MVNIQEVADKTYHFETPVKGINRVLSVYIIKEEKQTLIDPGPANAIPFIQEAMKKLDIKDFTFIIPTHIHLDHAGAAGQLLQLFPKAKVFLHPSAVRHAVEPSRLIQGTKQAFGENFESVWGPIIPINESRITVPADGEKFSLGGRDIRIFHTPGHANHHISVFDEKTRGIFSGEALGVPKKGAENFPLPAVVPPSFDIDEYVKTMEMLRALKPKLIFYGHDGVGKDPEKLIAVAEENTKTLGDIVLKALKNGESSQEIGHRLHEYIYSCTGTGAEETDRTLTVQAYVMYFKKKGLVQ